MKISGYILTNISILSIYQYDGLNNLKYRTFFLYFYCGFSRYLIDSKRRERLYPKFNFPNKTSDKKWIETLEFYCYWNVVNLGASHNHHIT